MKDDDNWIEFEGTIDGATTKAVLFYGDTFEKPEWIPRSQMRIVQESVPNDPKCIIEIKEWLCKKNNWI